MSTGIEWTDEVWNPVTGCSKVSPGCAHCYAEEVHRRRLDGIHGYPPFLPWTPENAREIVVMRHDRLELPLKWRKPRRVFVNSMSDLFHEEVTADFIIRVFVTMAQAEDHTFQILTKRPERMRDLLNNATFELKVRDKAELDRGTDWQCPWPLPNVWLGTSIENRRYVDRADALRETPAAIRFISAEPLLGPLIRPDSYYAYSAGPSSGAWPDDYLGPELDLWHIDWLIVGGESGPKHRPIEKEWVRDLCQAALARHTAFFFKQWGGHQPGSNGRELDGRTWDQMPTTEAA